MTARQLYYEDGVALEHSDQLQIINLSSLSICFALGELSLYWVNWGCIKTIKRKIFVHFMYQYTNKSFWENKSFKKM